MRKLSPAFIKKNFFLLYNYRKCVKIRKYDKKNRKVKSAINSTSKNNELTSWYTHFFYVHVYKCMYKCIYILYSKVESHYVLVGNLLFIFKNVFVDSL